MAFARETIYTALAESLNTIQGVTVSRRLKHWTDVTVDEQPYIGISQARETAETETGRPTKWFLEIDLYLYVTAPSDVAVGTVLNPMLDAVCELINAVHPITGKNTLGLPAEVNYCRVQGSIETDEGTLGQQAVAIIPVVIFATSS